MENKKKGLNKKALVGIVALAAVIAVFAVVYTMFRERPVEGSKSISIEVVDMNQITTVYKLKTDALYLRQAMEEAEGLTFGGEETAEYGMMLDTVNGEKADTMTGAYWAVYVNGDYGMYGIDYQPIEDGDSIKIEYTIFVPEG